MNEIRVEICCSGKVETTCKEWKEVYQNEHHEVYENEFGTIKVFDDDKKSFLHTGLDELIVCDWLNDKYFRKIVFTIFTVRSKEKGIEMLKRKIEKHISEKYAFLLKVDYSLIKLEVEP